MEIPVKLKHIRIEKGLTVHALALRAGISPSFLSKVEKGDASPTVVTLKKILQALDMELEDFFSRSEKASDERIVFSSKQMTSVQDRDKKWCFAFPRNPEIKAQLSYEEFFPNTKKVELETHKGDICGYVIEGELTIEVKNEGEHRVREGDAFYVKAGKMHGGRNKTSRTAKIICVRIF